MKVETSRSGQKRKRGGGSADWVATRAVLGQICIDMRVADRVVLLVRWSPKTEQKNRSDVQCKRSYFVIAMCCLAKCFMAFVSLSSPSLYSPGYSEILRGLLRATQRSYAGYSDM